MSSYAYGLCFWPWDLKKSPQGITLEVSLTALHDMWCLWPLLSPHPVNKLWLIKSFNFKPLTEGLLLSLKTEIIKIQCWKYHRKYTFPIAVLGLSMQSGVEHNYDVAADGSLPYPNDSEKLSQTFKPYNWSFLFCFWIRK